MCGSVDGIAQTCVSSGSQRTDLAVSPELVPRVRRGLFVVSYYSVQHARCPQTLPRIQTPLLMPMWRALYPLNYLPMQAFTFENITLSTVRSVTRIFKSLFLAHTAE